MLLVARENLLRIDPRQQGGAPNRTHNSTHALRGGGGPVPEIGTCCAYLTGKGSRGLAASSGAGIRQPAIL